VALLGVGEAWEAISCGPTIASPEDAKAVTGRDVAGAAGAGLSGAHASSAARRRGALMARQAIISRTMPTFSHQVSSTKPTTEVHGAALKSFSKPLRGVGYKLQSQTPEAIVWRRTPFSGMLRSPWSVLWFPLGLISGSDTITMSFASDPQGHTIMTIAGSGPRRVAKKFEKLAL